MYVILSLHALVNLANVVNGATTRFIGERSERSEQKIWHGSLVNLANLVNASEHYLVLDMILKKIYAFILIIDEDKHWNVTSHSFELNQPFTRHRGRNVSYIVLDAAASKTANFECNYICSILH